MSAAAAGAVASAFQIGYALSLVGFNLLSDRVGARPAFLWSSLAGAPAAMAFALFADGPVSAALLYGVTALSMGGNYTPGLILIAERVPVATRGRATGFFLAATSVGYAASLFLTGAVLARFGWRAALVAGSLGPVVGAGVALWTMWGTPTRIHPRRAGQGFGSEFLRNPAALLLTASYTFHSWELLGMWAWTPAFLSASLVLQGQDLARATGGGARLTALFHLTGFLASSTAGHLSDRFGRTTVIIAMLAVSTACSLTFGWLVAAPFWILLLVGLAVRVQRRRRLAGALGGAHGGGGAAGAGLGAGGPVPPRVRRGRGGAVGVRQGAGRHESRAALHRVGVGLRAPRDRRSGGPRLHDLASAPARESAAGGRPPLSRPGRSSTAGASSAPASGWRS